MGNFLFLRRKDQLQKLIIFLAAKAELSLVKLAAIIKFNGVKAVKELKGNNISCLYSIDYYLDSIFILCCK